MATRDKLATANEKPTAKLTAKHDKLTAKQEGLATVSSKLATLMAAPDTLVGEHGKLVEGHHNLEIEGGRLTCKLWHLRTQCQPWNTVLTKHQREPDQVSGKSST